jgi:hypothetical protein
MHILELFDEVSVSATTDANGTSVMMESVTAARAQLQHFHFFFRSSGISDVGVSNT